jgi:hypothetical protein
MLHPVQDLQRAPDDLVRGRRVQARDEADAAGVVLVLLIM